LLVGKDGSGRGGLRAAIAGVVFDCRAPGNQAVEIGVAAVVELFDDGFFVC